MTTDSYGLRLHSTTPPLVGAYDIDKHFAGVTALRNVTFEVAPGEIHALVGENGAGKSTLAKIVAGVYRADAGHLEMGGKEVDFHSPLAAQQAGVVMVHQELHTINSLTVAENVLLQRESTRFGFVSKRQTNARAVAYLDEVGLRVAPGAQMSGLSVGTQTLVEVAHALAAQSQVVIMDEPTSSLPTSDAAHLLGILRRLAESGRGVVLISHALDEVLRTADRVTVLRDGEWVATERAADLTEERLIQLVVGRKVSSIYTARSIEQRAAGREERLTAEKISAPGVAEASFAARSGEILGFGGLVGSGRSELMAAVMGASRASAGTMHLGGRRYRPRSPLDALEAGISLVPESRKEQGLVLDHSVLANFELTALDRFGRGPFVAGRAARKRAAGLVERLNIKLSNFNQPVSSLSGGNQQKVVIAKALATDPRVLLLDEPTRGIDIGAKSEIHSFIRELVDEGMAVVMVTSVLPELLQASDRIMVMKAGRTVAELEARSATEEEVTRFAFQG